MMPRADLGGYMAAVPHCGGQNASMLDQEDHPSGGDAGSRQRGSGEGSGVGGGEGGGDQGGGGEGTAAGTATRTEAARGVAIAAM